VQLVGEREADRFESNDEANVFIVGLAALNPGSADHYREAIATRQILFIDVRLPRNSAAEYEDHSDIRARQ
jgi:hypothetical protein